MINFGGDLSGVSELLGLLDIGLAIFYCIYSTAVPRNRSSLINEIGQSLYIVQAIIAPIVLLLIGIIILSQGWRLDPLLLFAFFLMNFLLVYMGTKEFFAFQNRR